MDSCHNLAAEARLGNIESPQTNLRKSELDPLLPALHGGGPTVNGARQMSRGKPLQMQMVVFVSDLLPVSSEYI